MTEQNQSHVPAGRRAGPRKRSAAATASARLNDAELIRFLVDGITRGFVVFQVLLLTTSPITIGAAVALGMIPTLFNRTIATVVGFFKTDIGAFRIVINYMRAVVAALVAMIAMCGGQSVGLYLTGGLLLFTFAVADESAVNQTVAESFKPEGRLAKFIVLRGRSTLATRLMADLIVLVLGVLAVPLVGHWGLVAGSLALADHLRRSHGFVLLDVRDAVMSRRTRACFRALRMGLYRPVALATGVRLLHLLGSLAALLIGTVGRMAVAGGRFLSAVSGMLARDPDALVEARTMWERVTTVVNEVKQALNEDRIQRAQMTLNKAAVALDKATRAAGRKPDVAVRYLVRRAGGGTTGILRRKKAEFRTTVTHGFQNGGTSAQLGGLPRYVAVAFMWDPTEYQMLMVLYGLGSVIGAYALLPFAEFIERRVRLDRAELWLITPFSVVSLVMAFSPYGWGLALALFLSAVIGSAIIPISRESRRRAYSDDEYVPASAAYDQISLGGQAIGSTSQGGLARSYGAAAPMQVGALLSVLGTLVVLFWDGDKGVRVPKFGGLVRPEEPDSAGGPGLTKRKPGGESKD